MRNILVFLAILLVSPSFSSEAEDVMVGSVVSVDREKGEVEIRPIGPSKRDGSVEETVKFAVSPEQLQSFVVDGARIRIWGDFSSEARTGVAISPLRGGRSPGGSPPPPDPTGVRSRISEGLERPGGMGPPGRPGRHGGPGGAGGKGR